MKDISEEIWKSFSIHWDRFFIEYAIYEDFIKEDLEFNEIKNKFLHSQRIPPKKINNKLTYRMINHWSEIWILEWNIKNKWRKLSFTELVWISIVIELRWFWMSLNNILTVKKSILDNNKHFEFNLVKILTAWKNIKVLVLNNWISTVADEIEINFWNCIGIWNHLTVNLKSIVEWLIWKKIKDESTWLYPLSSKEFNIYKEIKLSQKTNIKLKSENWSISKYKIWNNKEFTEIDVIKNMNIFNLIKTNINSTLHISTNDYWSISNIVLEK